MLALLNKGDEVVVFSPFWVSYDALVRLAEATPVLVKGGIENDFKVTAKQLEAAITPRTRAIIFSSPCNPTGSVFSKQELEAIAQVVLKHEDLLVISDEIYEHINYNGSHESIAQFPSVRDRVILVNGVSKSFAMTGWRIGYSLAGADWTRAMAKVQGHSTSNATSISQAAAVEALTGPQDSVATMLAEYTRRREWLLDALNGIPGLKCPQPEGAFYAFPDVRGCLNGRMRTSEDFATELLEKEQTVVTDGAGFGAEGFIRISYATSLQRLEEGVRRIRRVAEG
jgi:aspartate aminotransferase